MRDILLPIHIAAGAIALAAMPVPMIARKGSPLHRRVGWVFVVAMAIVAGTAFALAIGRFATGVRPRDRGIGLFLFSVSALAAATVSTGVRVLRFKHRVAAHRHLWDLGLSIVLVGSAVASLVYGAITGWVLLVLFSPLGLAIGTSQLAYWLRAPKQRMHWWLAHMGAMLGGCVAAITALVVTTASRLGAGTFTTAVWLAIPIICVPLIGAWQRSYRRRQGSL
jgi:hypothetical protein